MKIQKANKTIFPNPTDEQEILSVIKNLKLKKSTGFDDMNTIKVTQLKHGLPVPLTLLVNRNMETGDCPNQLKMAKVIPLHKWKEKYILGNYISTHITSHCAKIFFKIFSTRIITFWEDKNLLIEKMK